MGTVWRPYDFAAAGWTKLACARCEVDVRKHDLRNIRPHPACEGPLGPPPPGRGDGPAEVVHIDRLRERRAATRASPPTLQEEIEK